jgi:hypothetical protein
VETLLFVDPKIQVRAERIFHRKPGIGFLLEGWIPLPPLPHHSRDT